MEKSAYQKIEDAIKADGNRLSIRSKQPLLHVIPALYHYSN